MRWERIRQCLAGSPTLAGTAENKVAHGASVVSRVFKAWNISLIRTYLKWRLSMGTLQQDVRFALRMMGKNLGFTTAAVLCLMLGIGATTGIFTVVNAVLLHPLPYSHPEQLVRVYTEFPTFPNGGLHRFWTSGPEFIDLKRDTNSWATLDAWITNGANLAGKTQPVRVNAAYLSGGLLESLAVSPIKGRLISQSDDAPGVQAVADLSYGTW